MSDTRKPAVPETPRERMLRIEAEWRKAGFNNEGDRIGGEGVAEAPQPDSPRCTGSKAQRSEDGDVCDDTSCPKHA